MITFFNIPFRAWVLGLLSFCSLFASAQERTLLDSSRWTILAPGEVSLPDIRETSPSMTASGDTLVFARTENWGDKVPYLAVRQGEGWQVEKLPFADTLYNLAITPDGQTIFLKQYDQVHEEKVSRVFRVDREGHGWSEPMEQDRLFNINAGYFCPMADGRLYFFARLPQPGIYYSEPQADGSYGAPVWLSDGVGEAARTPFDVFVHPDEDRLFITLSFSQEEEANGLGPDGIYYLHQEDNTWQEPRWLPIPYSWGATVTPRGQFIFVDAGDLQVMDLKDLNVEW